MKKYAVRGPIGWRGGKSRQGKTLVSLFPEHHIYTEPFMGGGLIFFKPACECEVVNDLDGNLMNFWRVCRDDHEALIRSFDYMLSSRKVFENYKDKYHAGEYASELERAHIFYYLNLAGFGGDMKNLSFGRRRNRPNFATDTLEQNIKKAHKRLQSVRIECRDFAEVMRFYDSPDTLHYLDPPYRCQHKYATPKFKDERYAELADICRELQGKFLLTLNDDEFLRDTFREFNVQTYETYYRISKKGFGRGSVCELIITNY